MGDVGTRRRGLERLTVVYLDELFLLNFVVDYLLLLSSARLAGEPLHRGRMALGAALGGIYAALLFLEGLGFLAHPLCRLAAAVGMLLCAFGGSRRLLRLTLMFFAVSAAFGGGILALELLGGGLAVRGGVFTSALDLRLILLSAAVCYVLITLVLQRTARHSALRGELVPAVLDLAGRRAALTALVDTGNTLTDPATNRPVMVAEGRCLAGLFPPGEGPEEGELSRPVAALERLAGRGGGLRFRLLPYRAVGVECGLLLAVRVDRARVGTEDYGSILVALSPTPVSDGGGYQALIGA